MQEWKVAPTQSGRPQREEGERNWRIIWASELRGRATLAKRTDYPLWLGVFQVRGSAAIIIIEELNSIISLGGTESGAEGGGGGAESLVAIVGHTYRLYLCVCVPLL